MRILWVKAGGLVPQDTGGKIRSYHILKELTRKHEITFFTFYAAHANDAHGILNRLFARVVCRPLPIPGPRSLADYASYACHLFSPHPHMMARYYRPSIAKEVRDLAQTERYDVIVCDFLIPAPVIPWESPCPKVLFTHNVEATIYRRHYELARNPLWKVACWRECRTTAQAERAYVERADHILTVSEADRHFFARFVDPCKITSIPTGVDVEYFRPAPELERPNTLVFTGSMDWLPNEDAMLYFADQILPRIRREIPDVSFVMVGRCPSARLQVLVAANQGMEATGRVEDIRPYMRQGSVYIVPLRIGGGTRLKIFEAMAMGKAVVSTSIGAEGLPVKDGENILLADKPEDFARSVVTLLRDRAARVNLGGAARRLVEQNYSWPAVAACFESVLLRLAQKSPDSVERAKVPEYGTSRA